MNNNNSNSINSIINSSRLNNKTTYFKLCCLKKFLRKQNKYFIYKIYFIMMYYINYLRNEFKFKILTFFYFSNFFGMNKKKEKENFRKKTI